MASGASNSSLTKYESRYLNRPEETAKSFDSDGWFRTGDRAETRNGRYFILGRESVDILKVAGYKISALDVERVILENQGVVSCAVVGIPDTEYGQVIGAVVVVRPVCAIVVAGALLVVELGQDDNERVTVCTMTWMGRNRA